MIINPILFDLKSEVDRVQLSKDIQLKGKGKLT
jgi:hypothetical protein